MGVTVGVTGHRRGFGKYIFEALPEPKKGFSLSNGWNINHPYFLRGLDCIINNAEDGWGQIELAIKAHELNIHCINIGSLITDAKVTNEHMVAKQAKLALKAFSEEVGQPYLTWGFLAWHELAENNPHIVTTITVNDALKEVLDEYERWLALI